MKNFRVRYLVDGTSALDSETPQVFAGAENIITFPGCDSPSTESTPSKTVGLPTGRRAVLPIRTAYGRVLNTEMAQSIRYGTAQGRAYNRIRPWQAAVAGCVFSLLALISIFVNL